MPRALPKILENREIPQKLGSGRVWGETGTPKHLQDTIQSIWVTGFPISWVVGPFPKQNRVFVRAPFPWAQRGRALRRSSAAAPAGPKVGAPWELGNTVRTPQCKHCLGNCLVPGPRHLGPKWPTPHFLKVLGPCGTISAHFQDFRFWVKFSPWGKAPGI